MPTCKLDEALRALFLQDMSVASRRMRGLFDTRARESGMTYSRARLLLHLAYCPAATQGELAQVLEIEQPTVARLIDGMEKAGLITREVSAEDRRVRHVALTEAGQGQVKDVLSITEKLREDLLRGVSPNDLEAAHRVVVKVLANIAAA